MPAIGHALRAERLRTVRRFALFRLIGITVFLLFAGFVSDILALPGWRVNVPLFVGYWAAASAVWLAARSSDRAAELAGLTIAFMDMPAVTSLQWCALDIADPGFVYGSNGALLILFILASMATLEERLVVVATGMAIILQTALGLRIGGAIATTIVFSILMMVCALAGCRYVVERIRSLVAEATAEHDRRERLGRYFSPEVASLLAGSATADAPGAVRDVTVLFSDLRDFTSLSERLSGPETLALLNAYHERMVAVVFGFGGTLDKYLGDGMMVYFGAPIVQPDHATRGVECARAMQAELARWNVERGTHGEPALRMGIGVHSGPAVVGDVGTATRREYTAIGHTVNIAAHLQELTKTVDAPVLVSDEVRRRVGSAVTFYTAATLPVRGRTEPMTLYAPAA